MTCACRATIDDAVIDLAADAEAIKGMAVGAYHAINETMIARDDPALTETLNMISGMMYGISALAERSDARCAAIDRAVRTEQRGRGANAGAPAPDPSQVTAPPGEES